MRPVSAVPAVHWSRKVTPNDRPCPAIFGPIAIGKTILKQQATSDFLRTAFAKETHQFSEMVVSLLLPRLAIEVSRLAVDAFGGFHQGF